MRIAEEIASPYVDFMGRLVQAGFQVQEGRKVEAVRSLEDALPIGRRHGFVNTHTWDPNTMARLCAMALEHGIERDYVRLLVQRRGLTAGPDHTILSWPWPIKVFTLGRFRLLRDDQPLTFTGKVQRRPLDLLKAVVGLGQGAPVRETRLIDALWPDADGDAGKFA